MALVPAEASFWRKFAPLFGAGLLGVASVVPLVRSQIDRLPEAARASLPPLPIVVGLSLAQSALLVGASVALGIPLARRLGLRSHLVEREAAGAPVLAPLRRDLPVATAAGFLSYALISAGDQVIFRPLMGQSWQTLNASAGRPTVATFAMGVLYGGIVEELLMRWGLMTLLAWGAWRALQHGVGEPRAAIIWGANITTALVFGAGHLPITSTIIPLTPAVVGRALLLNGVAGTIFGWLYWRRSLEAAMVGHAMTNVIATIVTLVRTA